jgi:hypothetical protein
MLARTSTTAFLAWIAPRSSTPPAANLPELRRQQEALIVPAEGRAWLSWSGVQVVVEAPAHAEGGTLLLAQATDGDWHFRIDRDGRTVAGERWRKQLPTLHGGSSIRVSVVRQGDTVPFSAAQWLSLRALITQLASRCPTGDSGMPVRLPDGLFQAFGLTPAEQVYLPPLPVSGLPRKG